MKIPIFFLTLILAKLAITESIDYKNLSRLLNYNYNHNTFKEKNEFLVRKVDSKYGFYSENALIQYLNSQIDDLLTHEYHLISATSIISQYNFTLSIELMINNEQLIENLDFDDEIEKLFDEYFIQEFIQLYNLKRYLKEQNIHIKNSKNILITIRLCFKETNIEVLNTRLKYLLLIIRTLFTKDGLKLFKLFQLTADNSISIKRVELTSTAENAFCMGINRLELERFIYPFDKLIDNNLIIEKGNLILRLNSYNRLLSISNTDGMIYQYKILFDENSFKIDNEVDIKLCHQLPNGDEYEYSEIDPDKIFIETVNVLICNLTESDLYYINDRHVLIGLHLSNNFLHFTPYGQNGSFLTINCTSCQQIGYRTYLVCLRKIDSSTNEKAFLELNNEVKRFMTQIKVAENDNMQKSAASSKLKFIFLKVFIDYLLILIAQFSLK